MLDLLQQADAIKRGDYILASGEKTNFYVDLKQALLQPTFRSAIVEKLTPLLHDNCHVAGYGLGGTLLVACVPIPGLVIREKVKSWYTSTNRGL